MLYGEELKNQLIGIINSYEQKCLDASRECSAMENAGYDFDLSRRYTELSHECNDSETKLRILENGGLGKCTCIFDANGKEHSYHIFRNKWGCLSYVCNGIFASSLTALEKKLPSGWVMKECDVPMWINKDREKVRWHTNMWTGECVGFPQN